MGAWPIGDVVINAHRKWVWFLENHADAFAQVVDIHGAVNIFAFEEYVPFDAAAFDEVVHAIEGFQQGGFPAAGWPDECGDLVWLDLHIDTVKRMEIAVVKIQIFDIKFKHSLTYPFSGNSQWHLRQSSKSSPG